MNGAVTSTGSRAVSAPGRAGWSLGRTHLLREEEEEPVVSGISTGMGSVGSKFRIETAPATGA